MKLNIAAGIPPPMQVLSAHDAQTKASQVARAEVVKTDIQEILKLREQIVTEKTACEQKLLELQELLTEVQVLIDGAEEDVAIVTEGDNWRPHRRNNGSKK